MVANVKSSTPKPSLPPLNGGDIEAQMPIELPAKRITLTVKTFIQIIGWTAMSVCALVGSFYGGYYALDKRVGELETYNKAKITSDAVQACYIRLLLLTNIASEKIKRSDIDKCENRK